MGEKLVIELNQDIYSAIASDPKTRAKLSLIDKIILLFFGLLTLRIFASIGITFYTMQPWNELLNIYILTHNKS